MKNITLIILTAMLVSACSPMIIETVQQNPQPQYRPAPPPVQPAPADYQLFYDQLSPYGSWIDFPNYGYVWQPNNVDYGFKPYATNGQWVYSDYGWTWASNYNWGWAAFHYGRWFYNDGYGWLWKPGHEWAPAWVTWGQSGDYYGWAPIGPEVNISINIGSYNPPPNYWTFVPHEHIGRPDMDRYVINDRVTIVNNISRNVVIINNVNNSNVVYHRGPFVGDVERFTHAPVNRVVVNETSRPGESLSNNNLTVYRPAIKAPVQNQVYRPAPQRVQTYSPRVDNSGRGVRQQAPVQQTPVQQQVPNWQRQAPPQQAPVQQQAQPVQQVPTQQSPDDRRREWQQHQTQQQGQPAQQQVAPVQQTQPQTTPVQQPQQQRPVGWQNRGQQQTPAQQTTPVQQNQQPQQQAQPQTTPVQQPQQQRPLWWQNRGQQQAPTQQTAPVQQSKPQQQVPARQVVPQQQTSPGNQNSKPVAKPDTTKRRAPYRRPVQS